MECGKCGRPLVEGAAFCPYCGEKAVQAAPGADVPLYSAEIKGLFKAARLTVYRDRTEYGTSSVQKTIFDYSALIAVKKGVDRILFITEDGQTETCVVGLKIIHEAFLYIEKAAKPYIEERKRLLAEKGIRYSFVSTMGLTGGILNILDDRAEFKAKSGQTETVCFENVKSVGLSMEMLKFSLIDGTAKSFTLDKELRAEVLSFTLQAVEPYIARRKEALLAQGIYFSFHSTRGTSGGTLNFYSDRVEFLAAAGENEAVPFERVRAVSMFAGTLQLALTDGTVRSFSVEKDVRGEVLAFAEEAVAPYIAQRTEGFTVSFGIDEQIELNEERGVFHILRQGGKEISDEYPLEDVIRCAWTESVLSGAAGSAAFTGTMPLMNDRAGMQRMPETEAAVRFVGVLLTLCTDGQEQTILVRFGDFPLGIGKTNKKYESYAAETTRFLDYLREQYPACTLILPEIHTAEESAETMPEPGKTPELAEASALENANAGPLSAHESSSDSPETDGPDDAAAENDQLGSIQYIEGVSKFIGSCTTPMTIAIQGSWGSGKNSVVHRLSDHLEKRYPENFIRFPAPQFSQTKSDKPLSLRVGNELITRLSDTGNEELKKRVFQVVGGLINITSGFLSNGSSDGQKVIDAIFKTGSPESFGKIKEVFSALVKERAAGDCSRVIFFVEDLDKLPPAKGVELLEAITYYSDCEGCIFVAAADSGYLARGAREKYGPGFDEAKEKALWNKTFQISFRVPVSDEGVQKYCKEKLEHMGVCPLDDAELLAYIALIRHSVGCEPNRMDRLFDSFFLIKNMADAALYQDKDRRLMLFALLCMQAQYRELYEHLVRMKDHVTPELLLELCDGSSELLEGTPQNGNGTDPRHLFAKTFADIINTDKRDSITEAECRAFAEVLNFSCITSQ